MFKKGGGVQSAVILLSRPIHHIQDSTFSTQREMVIKAKMPNYAWLSTIKDSAAAKFRGHLQLRGPFTTMAVLAAVICSSLDKRAGERAKERHKKKKVGASA